MDVIIQLGALYYPKISHVQCLRPLETATQMTLNERVGHVLVAIPLAHILGSALFLWSYCTGFGSHLASHASAADLLSVSITDMVFAYIVSLILPSITLAARLSMKHPYAMDYANSISDEESRDRAKKRVEGGRRAIFWISLIIAIIAHVLVAYKLFQNEPFPFLLSYLGIFPIIIYSFMAYSESRGLTAFQYEISAVILGFILALLFTGLDKGQTDRFRYYESSYMDYTKCKEALILRQMSGKYLVILPNSSKAIISDKCDLLFAIPPTTKSNPLGPPPSRLGEAPSASEA